MNSRKIKEVAKKRLQQLISQNKGNEKGERKTKWDLDKEFNFIFHDKSTSDLDIILNPDTFQGLEEGDFIEIISTTNSELRILFKIKKQHLEKNKSSISILSVYNELIKNQNENFNKSSVFVRPVNTSDYIVDKITLLFKEQFLSRKDIFLITQSLIDNTIYINKEIKMNPKPDGEETPAAVVSHFRGSKLKVPLTGLVTSSTEFQLRSLSAGIFFLVEISKDTYDFTYSSKKKFELIIEFFKNTVSKLKESECSHIINIVFFSRIYFNKKENRKFLKNSNKYNSSNNKYKTIYSENIGDFIYQSTLFPDEYFFDIYSSIIKININKLDTKVMTNNLFEAFNTFATIFKVTNLAEYLNNIKKLSPSISRYNSFANKSFSEINNLFTHNINNFNNFFSQKFFEQVKEFRMTKSTTSNLFEAINVIVNDIKFEKKKLYKLGNIINVISSGEYFPYYNYRLAKITKENLFEQGCALSMIYLCNKSKVLDLYIRENLNIFTENDTEKDMLNLIRSQTQIDRLDRESFFSLKGSAMKENDIRLTIAKNNDILDNLNDKCIRKNSIEPFHRESNLIHIQNYKNEPDVFNHVIPKWMKLFFITNYNSVNSSKIKLSKNRSFSHLGSIGYPLSTNNLNPKAIRKMSAVNQPDNNLTIPQNIDNDIFNSRKYDDSNYLKDVERRELVDEEYQDLMPKDSAISLKKSISNDDLKLTTQSSAAFFNENVFPYIEYTTEHKESKENELELIKDKLNIYNKVFEKIKTSKMKEGDNIESIKLDLSPTNKNINNIENGYLTTKEYENLKKKAKEYDNEIFVKKSSRKNSYAGRLKNDKLSNTDENKSSRDILHSFEFNENYINSNDEFQMVVELLTQVPLLPIFSEFKKEMKEDVRMAPHQLSCSLNNDCNILEEIIFERINNNYQIVKQKTHSEDYNKKLDLKTISSIQLFDRRFYHIILVEDQNYKVQIFNYSNKMNKLNYLLKENLKGEDVRQTILEPDINLFDYNFLIYDKKINLISGKKMGSRLGEKNEVFWSNYDIRLNDLNLNYEFIKFKNEFNYLLVDKFEDNAKKKKSRLTNFSGNFGEAYFKVANSDELDAKKDSGSKYNTCSDNSKVISRNTVMFSDISISDNFSREYLEESYKDRVKQFICTIETYFTKFPKFKDKFNDKFSYLEMKDFIKENDYSSKIDILMYNLIFLNEGTDWVLFIHNNTFNERNSLFFSLRWLSCNSIHVQNLHKEMIKKSKSKNLALVKVPCDEIINSNFKRLVQWKICLNSKFFILDKLLTLSICSNFIRCEFEGNYIYINEEHNLLIKFSHKGFLFLYDEIVEQTEYNSPSSYFQEYAISLDILLDVFDYVNHLIDKINI